MLITQPCTVGSTEESSILCVRPTKYHQKLTTYSSLPTLSGCSIASGIIILELFPKELEKSLPGCRYTQKHTLNCLKRDANLSGDNRVWWECENTLHRGEVWGGWHGTHTIHWQTHSKWHGHTRHCARPLTITHTRTHSAGFVSAASRGPIFAASSSTAPASGSKEGKRIKWWSTSQFRLQSQGWNRRRWDNAISCLPMLEWCNVSWQRNAQGQWGGTNVNQSKVHKAQVKPPDWNNDGNSRRAGEREESFICT